MNSVIKKAVLITLPIVLLPATTAFAALRTDRSFGNDGGVRPGFFPSDVMATSDGGFVAVGHDHATGTVAVRRFPSTGASDAMFGQRSGGSTIQEATFQDEDCSSDRPLPRQRPCRRDLPVGGNR